MIMTAEAESKQVYQMRVLCSLEMRPDALAMSDCCREPAVAAVRNEAGDYLYRCFKHRATVTRFGGPDKNQTIVGRYVTRLPA
jgi:hypothetical protein